MSAVLSILLCPQSALQHPRRQAAAGHPCSHAARYCSRTGGPAQHRAGARRVSPPSACFVEVDPRKPDRQCPVSMHAASYTCRCSTRACADCLCLQEQSLVRELTCSVCAVSSRPMCCWTAPSLRASMPEADCRPPALTSPAQPSWQTWAWHSQWTL